MSFYNNLVCIYYIIIVYIVSIWYVILQILETHKTPKVKKHQNKVALVTGGGRGIGFETSLQLLQAGMTVVIAGILKDQQDGVKKLKDEFKDHVLFLECDLSSLDSVRHLATKFKELSLPLHLLINNAGIMFAPLIETKDGYESHWQINYLSHFLLTHLLLENLAKSGCSSKPSRIVNLSSCLHFPGKINFDDINGKKCYSAEVAYMQSKLAMLMFASALARRLKDDNIPVLINAVHPAVTFTSLFQHVWWSNTLLGRLIKTVLKKPSVGADRVVYAATSEEVTEGGNYYENSIITPPSEEAQSVLKQEKLWQLSCQQIGIEREKFGQLSYR